MRHCTSIAALACIVACSATGKAPERVINGDCLEGRQWGDSTQGMSLSITSAKQRYASGEEIVVNVLLKNVGDKQVQLVNDGALSSYRPTVIGPDGKKLRLLSGKDIEEAELGGISCASGVLRPGEFRCAELALYKIFRIETPGKYVVSVRRVNISCIDGVRIPHPVSVPSNTLVITIDDSLPNPRRPHDAPQAQYVSVETPEYRKTMEFMHEPSKRVDAARWLGDNKVASTSRMLVNRIETILDSGDNSPAQDFELATLCFALGQMADEKYSLSAVKKVCDRFATPLPKWSDANAYDNLFSAFHGLSLMGHKKEAIAELRRLYEKHGGQMDAVMRAEFQRQLTKAEKGWREKGGADEYREVEHNTSGLFPTGKGT